MTCCGLQIRFVLAKVRRTKNSTWWNVEVNTDLYWEMVTALHRGTFADLNIITTKMLTNQQEVLG